MREISLHLLDIAENSVAAGARNITIAVREDLRSDRLFLEVEDDGKGMDDATAARVLDPFVTTRTTRKVGLGLPLLKEAAELCNGYLKLESTPGKGTRVAVEFQRNHIDRMPLGDLAGTMLTLLVSSSNVHWVFRYQVDDGEFIFDNEPLLVEFEDISLSEPGMLSYLRETIEQGISQLQPVLS